MDLSLTCVADFTTRRHLDISSILERAARLEASIDLASLSAAGLELDPLKFDFLYSYPPLSALPEVKNPLSLFLGKNPDASALYIHFPFCSYACQFCYFSKYIQSTGRAIELYLDCLRREIDFAARYFRPARIKSVYFGGGTPTYLEADQLARMIDAIADAFTVDNGIEWTVEASPETLDSRKLQMLISSGVNRISLGVQTFNEDILRDIGRVHTKAQAIDAIRLILSSGVPRHNIDLIHGFPGQFDENVLDDIGLVSLLDLPSVTWYQLWQHENTPLRRREEKQASVTPERILRSKCLVLEGMRHEGYVRDKVDWFLRDLSVAQSQQEYKWTGGNLLGLGLSAYGFIGDVCYYNNRSLAGYSRAVERSGLGVSHGLRLSPEQLLTRRVMLGIKSRRGVPRSILQSAAGSPEYQNLVRLLGIFLDVGLVELRDEHFHLSALGSMYGDEVASALDVLV